MLAVHEIGYQSQSAPLTVLGSTGQWGQVDTSTVTTDEIARELGTRGYSLQEHAPPVDHVPTAPTLTRAGAIMIATDFSIDYLKGRGHNIPVQRTDIHPRRCPTGSCPLPSATWRGLIQVGSSYASYYLKGGSLPDWAAGQAGHMTLHGYFGQDVLGPPAPGEQRSLFERHPWLAGSIGAIFSGMGTYFNSRMLAAELKNALPKETLSETDKAELRAMLQSVAPPGTDVDSAVEAATSPSWVVPVLIGGVVLLLVVMMMKR